MQYAQEALTAWSSWASSFLVATALDIIFSSKPSKRLQACPECREIPSKDLIATIEALEPQTRQVKVLEAMSADVLEEVDMTTSVEIRLRLMYAAYRKLTGTTDDGVLSLPFTMTDLQQTDLEAMMQAFNWPVRSTEF